MCVVVVTWYFFCKYLYCGAARTDSLFFTLNPPHTQVFTKVHFAMVTIMGMVVLVVAVVAVVAVVI